LNNLAVLNNVNFISVVDASIDGENKYGFFSLSPLNNNNIFGNIVFTAGQSPGTFNFNLIPITATLGDNSNLPVDQINFALGSTTIGQAVPVADQCINLNEDDCIYYSDDQCLWYSSQCMSECPGALDPVPLLRRSGSTCDTYCGNGYCDNVAETFATCPIDCPDPNLLCGPEFRLANCRTQVDCWANNGYWFAASNFCYMSSCPAGSVESVVEGGYLCTIEGQQPPPITREDNLISRLRFILTQDGKLAQIARIAGALRCYFDDGCVGFGDSSNQESGDNEIEWLLERIKIRIQDPQINNLQKTGSIASDLISYYNQS